MQRIDDAEEKLRAAIRRQLSERERTRRALEEKLRYFDLRPRLRRSRERLTTAYAHLESLARAMLNKRRQRFENLRAELHQLNPRLVLGRGYAIVLSAQGGIVKTASEVPVGSDIRVLFAADGIRANVTEHESE
jgi:exodeoxyribonuclease VII large subunit